MVVLLDNRNRKKTREISAFWQSIKLQLATNKDLNPMDQTTCNDMQESSDAAMTEKRRSQPRKLKT